MLLSGEVEHFWVFGSLHAEVAHVDDVVPGGCEGGGEIG